MPDGAFFNLNGLVSWAQYGSAAKSLLAALDIDDPEETLMVQLTISELSMVSFGLLILSRIFPEFAGVAADLSNKIIDLNSAQGFLKRNTDVEE